MTIADDRAQEAELTERARQGDPAAFGTLLRRYDPDLRGLVWSVVRSGPDTDDVLQTAYEKAFRGLAGFTGGSSLKTWLHAICYRAAIDHIRYEGRRRHLPIDTLDQVAGASSAADAALARADLGRAFKVLDTDQRVVLMLTAGLGFSFDEAAEVTGLPRGTVASKVSRGRRRLEQEMSR